MSDDLETAWQAASHEQRMRVLSPEALLWLDIAWRLCRPDQRRQFVAERAHEISATLDAALMMESPVESWRGASPRSRGNSRTSPRHCGHRPAIAGPQTPKKILAREFLKFGCPVGLLKEAAKFQNWGRAVH
jgi:hypothetical protein